MAVATVLVAGCGVWGWSTREAPPAPSVASAPVSTGTAAPDPGGAAATTTGPTARTTTHEEDVAVVQGLVVLDAQAVLLADALDGTDPGVAALADRITAEADPDLPGLVGWLEAGGAVVPDEASDPAGTDPDEHPDLPGGISGAQLDSLVRARGSNADRLFLGLLLSQDEATLPRLERAARTTTDDGLRSIAASAGRERSARIAEVTAMLERLT